MVVKLELIIDSVTTEGLKTGAKEVARQVKPTWDQNQLQFKVYTDGITNKLIGVWSDNRDDQILVRVYGNKTELFIDRNAEKRNIEILHSAGCAPQLYATFTNGVSYGFTKGSPISEDDVVQEDIWRAVTREMAKFHKIEEGDRTCPMLFPKFQRFLNLLPSSFSDVKMQERIEKCGYTKEWLTQEVKHLETCLSGLDCPVVFSHNDILLGNVIWNKTSQEAKFIDYEYGANNYQPYDIANHFNEFAGVDVVDYSRYPSKEFQEKWLRSYLSHFKGIPETGVDDAEVERWYVWVNKFSLASHVFWGIWALLQACHSSIDFDFFGYGIIRLNEYIKRKEEVLRL